MVNVAVMSNKLPLMNRYNQSIHRFSTRVVLVVPTPQKQITGQTATTTAVPQ